MRKLNNFLLPSWLEHTHRDMYELLSYIWDTHLSYVRLELATFSRLTQLSRQ